MVMVVMRNQHTISFQYVLYRHGGEVITKENILPHYIKESNQLWYVLAYDADGYQLRHMALIESAIWWCMIPCLNET